MSMRTMDFSSSNRYSATALASSVLPTPVGPAKKSAATGRRRSLRPALITDDHLRGAVHGVVLRAHALGEKGAHRRGVDGEVVAQQREGHAVLVAEEGRGVVAGDPLRAGVTSRRDEPPREGHGVAHRRAVGEKAPREGEALQHRGVVDINSPARRLGPGHAAQDGRRVGLGGLLDAQGRPHRGEALVASLQRRPGRGGGLADHGDLARGEHRPEHLRDVVVAVGRAARVEELDDVTEVEHGLRLPGLVEAAVELRLPRAEGAVARDEPRRVEGEDRAIPPPGRTALARHDPRELRERRRLSHPRLAHEHHGLGAVELHALQELLHQGLQGPPRSRASRAARGGASRRRGREGSGCAAAPGPSRRAGLARRLPVVVDLVVGVRGRALVESQLLAAQGVERHGEASSSRV